MPPGKVVLTHELKPESKFCKYRYDVSEVPQHKYVSTYLLSMSFNSKANHNKSAHFSICALDLDDGRISVNTDD